MNKMSSLIGGASVSVVLLMLAAGCRGGSGNVDGEGGGAAGGPPTSDAKSLDCPTPGDLPFKTESQGFSDMDSKNTAEGSPRNKDEAADTLGTPEGLRANTYVDVEAPTTDSTTFMGRKARTGQNSGLSSIPLGNEEVSLWFYDGDASKWQSAGRAKADDEGLYSIMPDPHPTLPRGTPVYSILEADGSCAEHFEYILKQGTKVVVTDIDGTLTLSDDELFKQISDGSYVPQQNESADRLMSRWVEKGYVVIYLSARPHSFRSETRAWMRHEGFPAGPVITANTLVVDESARIYKRSWLNRIAKDFHWEIVAAYGNAASDVDAYEDVNIPKDHTFIVGELAGANGTQPINDNNYDDHIASFVEAEPDVEQ